MFDLRKNTRRSQKGQNITEYTILVILVIGAFIATSSYVKRGIQGRWREAVDEIGEQYDPTVMLTNIIYMTNTSTNTEITTQKVGTGIVTLRSDTTNTVEQKLGDTSVGGY